MTVYVLKQSKLDELKSNIDNNLKYYSSWTDSWLKDFFNDDNFLIPSQISASKVDLVIDPDNPYNSDIINVQKLYSAYKDINETQASDERLWATLCHTEYWEYMIQRWPASTVGQIKDRYFFGGSKRRALERNGLSRLWWFGHMTYDPDRSDPYELTKVLLKRQDDALNLLGRSFSNNREILRAILIALQDAENNNIEINRESFRQLNKALNMLGGTIILDALEEKDLVRTIQNTISQIAFQSKEQVS